MGDGNRVLVVVHGYVIYGDLPEQPSVEDVHSALDGIRGLVTEQFVETAAKRSSGASTSGQIKRSPEEGA
ncbi:hypothetical protein [Patulibacter sp. SYSU D01012]|uniref:hypothetical protein n=1 Tax=Patulibacter sp. SYSU D01012 TaxID=2817381 RepID=UPI001B30D737|nr:hypothetical protein [Patulibacter sp. SYSU D01012]